MPSFQIPNLWCASTCAFSNNYNTCYQQCTGTAQSSVSNPSNAYPPGTYGTTPIDVSGSKPVVDPNTGKTITSGTGVEPSSAPTTGGNYGTTSSSGTPTSNPATTLANINWADVGIRVGLVVGGGILVIIGIVKLFSGQPVVQNVPGTLARRPPTPPRPIVERRSFVETRPVSNPPPNPSVRTKANVAAAAAGAP